MHKWNSLPNGFKCSICDYKVLHVRDPETERGTRHQPLIKEIHVNNENMTVDDAEFQTVVWGVKCNNPASKRR